MPPLHIADRWQRFRVATVDRAPYSFLSNPHELALAVALVLLGVALLLQGVQPGSVTEQVPVWMAMVWSWALLLGGAGTIAGSLCRWPRVQWAGQNLTGYGCGFYALAVGTNVTLERGGVIVLVFAMLALVSWWQAFLIQMEPWIKARQVREAAKLVQKGLK